MAKQFLTLPTFPNSALEPFEVTSIATGNYNCIAWALEQTNRNYWPQPEDFFDWLPGVPRIENLESFLIFFKTAGYEVCENGLPESGFQKIALFAKDELPTHAARQLSEDTWTSKLGVLEDVRHSLLNISGGLYGEVVVYMKRKLIF